MEEKAECNGNWLLMTSVIHQSTISRLLSLAAKRVMLSVQLRKVL